MGAKVALFFLLDSSKAANPQNYGMQLPVQKIAPLYESLNASSRFAKMSFPDSTVYGFSFFKKPFQTDMLVVLKDIDNSGRKHFEAQCHAQLAKLLNVKDAFYYGDYMHRAIWLPRGLQKQEFLNQVSLATGEAEPNLDGVSRKYLGDNWLMNYRQGYIFGGKSDVDFCRSLALYGLGLAYHRQMSLLINRLSSATDLGGDLLNGALLDIQRFCAQYLFDNPVRPAHNEVFDSYAHIVKGLDLPSMEARLRLKMQDLNQLHQLKRSRDSVEGGWTDMFRAERRTVEKDKPKEDADKTTTGGRNLVLGVVVGVVLAVVLLSLSGAPLAQLQNLFK